MEAPEDLLGRHVGQRAKQRLLEARHHGGVFVGKELAHEGGRFGIGAAEQAHEGMAAAIGIRRHAQRDAEEGLDGDGEVRDDCPVCG